MEITVQYFTVLRKMTGKRHERIKIKDGSTLEGMLAILIEKYGVGFERYVSPPKEKKGRLQLVLLVNNQDSKQLNGLKARLKDGDTISLILPIAGG